MTDRISFASSCLRRASAALLLLVMLGPIVALADSLGATYRPEATTFALWSPDTANVQLSLDGTLHPMLRVADGNGLTDVYAVTVPGDAPTLIL